MTLCTPIITLLPGNQTFPGLPGRSILDSGLGAGIALPYRCANGSCGECRAKLITGDIRKTKFHDYTLSEADKISGMCLMCANSAVGDVQLEVNEARSVNDIPMQELRARRCRLERLDNIAIAGFRFIRGKAFRFLPGQRARLLFASGHTAELAIASCPCDAQFVEFHVPVSGSYAQLTALIGSLTSRDRITISGPIGNFTLSDCHDHPKLFIAAGEGFASMQSLLEHVFNLELNAPCCLLWIASPQISHYRDNLCRSWSAAFDNFDYIALRNGSDLEAMLRTRCHQYLASGEVYLSAPESCTTEILDPLLSAGADPNRIFIHNLPTSPSKLSASR